MCTCTLKYLEDGKSEGVVVVSKRMNNSDVTSVESARCDVLQLGIRPIQTVCLEILTKY